ncbi:hypothetical protein SDC9_67285 [bioreactor metagenome]|uniref:Uncharacterized protein n=1 Tax=bioreactor metagenome TaxID=1076179 RepID=A0A644XY80_9ZZZZ
MCGKCSVLFAHDAEATLFPSSTEVVLLVGKPVGIDDAFIDHLLQIGHGIIEFGLEKVQAGTGGSHVPRTIDTESTKDRLKAAPGPSFIVVDLLEGTIAVGVVLPVSIRILEGEGAHDFQQFIGGGGNGQAELVKPILADQQAFVLDDGTRIGQTVGLSVETGMASAYFIVVGLGADRHLCIHVVDRCNQALGNQACQHIAADHEQVGKVVGGSCSLYLYVLIAFV